MCIFTKNRLLITGFGLLFTCNWVNAQDSLRSSGTPRLHVSGYAEAYIGLDDPAPQEANRPYLFSTNRHNEFSVNVAYINVMAETERTRGCLKLGTGTYFAANYTAEPEWARTVLEATIGVRLMPQHKVWLDVGVLPSPFGYEGALSLDQLNLTRSLSAENSPYYLSGARLSGRFGRVSAALFAVNGWQNIQETNTNKSFALQLQYTPSQTWLVNLSTYYGDLPSQADNNRRQFFSDFYVAFTPNSRFQAVGLVDVGLQQQTPTGALTQATWYTANLTARYWLFEKLGLGARAEYFADADQAVVVPQTAETYGVRAFRTAAGSLNLDWRPAPSLLLRLEGRYLFSSQGDVFLNNAGQPVANYGMLTASLAVRLP